jgi:hypothetical protein
MSTKGYIDYFYFIHLDELGEKTFNGAKKDIHHSENYKSS